MSLWNSSSLTVKESKRLFTVVLPVTRNGRWCRSMLRIGICNFISSRIIVSWPNSMPSRIGRLVYRLSCHADLHTVSRCCNRGESEDHTGKKACKGSILVLKPRADITRSPKEGYQWPHKKDLCPPIFFFLKLTWLNALCSFFTEWSRCGQSICPSARR